MCSLVIVTVMLWPCAVGNTAAQETRKKSYDLSARKTGDVLKVSPKVWTDINRFVFLIAFDIYQPGGPETNLELVKQFNKLDNYPKLHQACRRWGDVTFQNLQRLAEELSTGDIRRLLTDLKSAVGRRPSDPVGAKKAFVVAADKLMGKINRWEGISKGVKEDLEFLSTQALAAATQLRGTQAPEARRIVDVGPELADVVAALAGVNDHWGALSSDLSALRKKMATNLNSEDPFMLDITLEIGLASWQAVEGAAKTFMTNVPMQRKYLTGDNYYDECPFDVNVWYLMQTKGFLIQTRDQPGYQEGTVLGTEIQRTSAGDVGGAQRDPTIYTQIVLFGKGSDTGNPDAKVQWQFQTLGRGWWRIINRAEGDSKNLELFWPWPGYLELPKSDRIGSFSVIVNDLKRTHDIADSNLTSANIVIPRQRWRCVPTGESNYFRIYNAALGERLSLKMPSLNSTRLMFATMEVSIKSPEQYWRFEAVPTK